MGKEEEVMEVGCWMLQEEKTKYNNSIFMFFSSRVH